MQQSRLDGVLPLKRQLQLLALPPAKKRRILGQVGRQLQKKTRANIRAQRDIYGRSFAKRTAKDRPAKQRRKLLRKMGRQLTQKTTDRQVEVGFKGIAGSIASQHHFGEKRTVTATAFKREMKKRRKGEEYFDKPATKEQAKVLVKQLGFRSKKRRYSQHWIRNNLTIGMAGAIIKKMRDEQGLPKRSNSSWIVETPARPFFGATTQVASAMAAEIIEQETVRQLAL